MSMDIAIHKPQQFRFLKTAEFILTARVVEHSPEVDRLRNCKCTAVLKTCDESHIAYSLQELCGCFMDSFKRISTTSRALPTTQMLNQQKISFAFPGSDQYLI